MDLPYKSRHKQIYNNLNSRTMDLITAIKRTYAQTGITKDFYAILCDSGAFNEEERWTKKIMKAMCDDGFTLQIARLRSSGVQWKARMHDIIYKAGSLNGYQRDLVAYVTHKLAIGLGLVDSSFDWEEEFGQCRKNPASAEETGTAGNISATRNNSCMRDNSTAMQGARMKSPHRRPNGEPVMTFHNKASGINFKMIKVDGGTFYMGLTPGMAEKAMREGVDWKTRYPLVTVSSYYIGETVVTQALWKAVMNKTAVTQPGWKPLMGDLNNPSKFKGDDLPVENVSWRNCQEFISKLNEATGLNFRLPTEAEWEFAAKGGQLSKGYEFAGSNNVRDIAWVTDHNNYNWHNQIFTKPVKMKLPNELGLYDMNGNVWEWCQDWYGELQTGTLINPKGPKTGQTKVQRGFSVLMSGESMNEYPCHRSHAAPVMRSPELSDQGYKYEGNCYDAYGFRLALSL